MKTLVIIAGAAGEIGTEFCKQVTGKNIDCIAVIRNRQVLVTSPYLQSIVCDLSDERQIREKFSSVDFSKYSKVIYLHTIGNDKFDPRGYPNIRPMNTIDPDIYNTNVNSFKYLMRYCVYRIKNINLTQKAKIKIKIAKIAGVADKYAQFVIESFCEVKYILRQYIQSQVLLYPEWVSGLSINVTSTITRSALLVRKYADTTYWLSPEDVAKQSIDILVEDVEGYKEIDLIKHSPSFTKGYYEDNKQLYEKWSRETGIK